MTSTSHPALPVEIAYLIIDHLSYGLNSLKPSVLHRPNSLKPLLSCALVSRSFHDRVAHHLFSCIIISQSMLSPRSCSKRTLSGLLGLLESDPHFSNRVRSLKLCLPSPSICQPWDKAPWTSFEDRMLTTVLNRLTSLATVHVGAIGPSIIRFSNLPMEMRVAIQSLLRCHSLTQVQIQGVSGLPIDFFDDCIALDHLEYYASPWFDEGDSDGMLASTRAFSHTTPVPFRLRVAWIRSCDTWIERMITGLAFSELKVLRYDLRQESLSLFQLSDIICQAASSLESVYITDMHAPSFLDDRRKPPLDITSLCSLRKIFIHSYGSFETHGTRLLRPLSECLSGSSVHNSAAATIRTVGIVINWGSIAVGDERFMFEPEDQEWTELDSALSRSAQFRRLNRVSIRITAGFKRPLPPSVEQGPPPRSRMIERMGGLFKRVKNMPGMRISFHAEAFWL